MSKHLSIAGKVKTSHWQHTLKVLQAGNLVLLPTAYNYLLVCLDEARLKPFGHKKRNHRSEIGDQGSAPQPPTPPNPQHPTPDTRPPVSRHLLVRDRSTFDATSIHPSPDLGRLADAFVPGELTLIANSPQGRTSLLSPEGVFIQSLLSQMTDPVPFVEVLDSDTVLEVKNNYNDQVDLWVDPGMLPFRPSTLVDTTAEPAQLLRKGVVPILDIDSTLGRRVKLGPDVQFAVLFVCTGNTCRSAMAQAMLEQKVKGLPVRVYSAGTHTYSGMPASEGALNVVLDYGADLSRHQSTRLTRRQIEDADLILVMKNHHRQQVLELCPEAASRMFLLTDYAGVGAVPQVHPGLEDGIFDPVGSPLDVFRGVAKIIAKCLDKVVADIRERF